MVKYILVSGGVLSGLGKGVIASSLGVLLKTMGLRVTAIKIDPYLNIDAGTMSPFEHGEVYVLDDGGEADLDLGNYERFMDVTLTKDNNITTGKIYNSVIEKERKGLYLGRTVQVVPHITGEIQEWIKRVGAECTDGSGHSPQMCIIELGGTIGDIEGAPFVEALRQLEFNVGRENFIHLHVSLVPVVGAVGEQKTKPTQASVREVRALGLVPDMIVCRSTLPLAASVKEKISNFCQVPERCVISVHDVSNLYRVPLLLAQQGVPTLVCRKLKLEGPGEDGLRTPNLGSWEKLANRMDRLNSIPRDDSQVVHIAMIGKYTGLSDSYLSVIKALTHASLEVKRPIVIDWVESEHLEAHFRETSPDEYDKAWKTLKAAHGFLVPGGFGSRGIEGMVASAKHARIHKVPYLGICLGMQVAVIEYARDMLGLDGATSTEFNEECEHDVVLNMPEISKTHMGGTMRLGLRRTTMEAESSLSKQLYGNHEWVDERHRHRYEVNPDYVGRLREAGLRFVGFGDEGRRAELVELSSEKHPFYVGCQYHPEFMTRPTRPAPLFVGLLLAATGQLDDYLNRISATSSIPMAE